MARIISSGVIAPSDGHHFLVGKINVVVLQTATTIEKMPTMPTMSTKRFRISSLQWYPYKKR